MRLEDLDLAGRRLLIRQDLNVPLRAGAVASDARIRAALPSLRLALERGAKTIVLSHLGRPEEARPLNEQPEASLAPVAARLGELLNMQVPLLRDWPGSGSDGPLALAENVRLLAGEAQNDASLARRMVANCDIFAMDAFATAHRAQASTCGAIRFAPLACAGPLLAKELESMQRALQTRARPFLAIVGGAKVSGKLPVLESLAEKVDQLVVGGGIANTFLAAAGFPIGKSIYDAEQLQVAAALMQKTKVHLPRDLLTARELSETAETKIRLPDQVRADEMILDVGPESSARLAGMLAEAGTILWNGPLGVFELEPFSRGTRLMAGAIAESSAFSLAGGGDTLAAIEKFGVAGGISHISTGGGAFLELVGDMELPAVTALAERARDI